MQAIVAELAALIEAHGWQARFDEAMALAAAHDVPSIAHLRTLADYLAHIDDIARWAPREAGDSRLVHDKMVEFYFFLDQPPLRALQSPIVPAVERTEGEDDRPMSNGHEAPTVDGIGRDDDPLSPLSRWIVDFARDWGGYLDTAESVEHVGSFRTNPAFHWDDYMPPPSGYRTFNQFFARHAKPGMRPVAAIGDSSVVVSPADAVFIDAWSIASDATIDIVDPTLDVKGIRWSIRQLLADSDYADRFAGGTFMHAALRTFDYHRFHAPVPGTVLESRIVRGQAWLDVEAIPAVVDGRRVNVLHAIEGTGYQFVQMRGLVVIDSPHGLVACLPVGMGHVSSVVLTAEVGATLHKGEELGYFQFGGSDFVMVFARDCRIELTCRNDAHYRQGAAIGRLHR